MTQEYINSLEENINNLKFEMVEFIITQNPQCMTKILNLSFHFKFMEYDVIATSLSEMRRYFNTKSVEELFQLCKRLQTLKDI